MDDVLTPVNDQADIFLVEKNDGFLSALRPSGMRGCFREELGRSWRADTAEPVGRHPILAMLVPSTALHSAGLFCSIYLLSFVEILLSGCPLRRGHEYTWRWMAISCCCLPRVRSTPQRAYSLRAMDRFVRNLDDIFISLRVAHFFSKGPGPSPARAF